MRLRKAHAQRPFSNSKQRCSVPGLEPARAPVIVSGAVVLGCVLDHFGLSEAVVSERDILHGAALLAAGRQVSARGGTRTRMPEGSRV